MVVKKNSNNPTISVLFVEQNKAGELARRLQKAEQDLGEKTGYKIRIVENAGTQLKRVFPSTNPWGTRDCSRLDCVICNQGDEDIQDCKRMNILYENKCTVCQVGKGESRDNGRGVYIGELARSLYERSKEQKADKEPGRMTATR